MTLTLIHSTICMMITIITTTPMARQFIQTAQLIAARLTLTVAVTTLSLTPIHTPTRTTPGIISKMTRTVMAHTIMTTATTGVILVTMMITMIGMIHTTMTTMPTTGLM